ncbi:unnamed protein product [Protopolystoma xenopodis]|uniref:Uncharacterized protein n=1 Tax=Protopolystoma xenopodis TaxID=117903 RepID=A0A3S5ANF3_9PLAT|nr:unnamed protein product [Protopolystoma xenopodis]
MEWINLGMPVVYFTASIPYLFLTILLVRSLLLPGGQEAIRDYYLSIDWSRLATGQVWMEAGQQIFWSLAPSWGITITLASHNNFDHRIYT